MKSIHSKVKYKSQSLSMQEIIHLIPGIICVIDAYGIIKFINNEIQQILGYDPDDLLNKNCFEFIDPHDIKKTIQAYNNLISGLDHFNFYNNCITKNGNIISVSWVCKWKAEEKLFYCNGQVKFDTQKDELLQWQFEKKVKQKQRDLLDILERIKEGFVAVDEENRIIYWNRQAEIISGRTREDVLSRNLFECYPHMLQSLSLQLLQKAKLEQQPQHYEYYYAESEKWLDVTIYPSQNGLTLFFRDITEKKILEENLELQKKEYQKKLTAAVIQAQEKERSQVGLELHDNINQVLTTIKLYTELSLSGVGGQALMEKSRGLLQNCIDEIRILSKQLSAPTLGSIRMKDSILELIDVVSATSKTCISLDMEEIEDLDVPQEIHLAIYRILQEHLTNILKHAEATSIQIIINCQLDELILKVIDNGKGFKIYENKKGIGISNMISRAESLGGRFNLNSAPGLGCVLIVQFYIH